MNEKEQQRHDTFSPSLLNRRAKIINKAYKDIGLIEGHLKLDWRLFRQSLRDLKSKIKEDKEKYGIENSELETFLKEIQNKAEYDLTDTIGRTKEVWFNRFWINTELKALENERSRKQLLLNSYQASIVTGITVFLTAGQVLPQFEVRGFFNVYFSLLLSTLLGWLCYFILTYTQDNEKTPSEIKLEKILLSATVLLLTWSPLLHKQYAKAREWLIKLHQLVPDWFTPLVGIVLVLLVWRITKNKSLIKTFADIGYDISTNGIRLPKTNLLSKPSSLEG